MTSYLLALDQGTSSSRSIIFDGEGREIASAAQEFPQLFPQPGWVEHDPAEILGSQLATVRDVLQKADLQASQISAIGITNQRETTLVWERKAGKPVYNAIVWQDRRTAPLCDELTAAGMASEIRERTGLVIDPYFSATKIRWILDNVEDAWSRAHAGDLVFGTVDTWLIWQLTKGKSHLTDRTNASRVMLYNLGEERWDTKLLSDLAIPAAILPEVRPSIAAFGEADAGYFGAAIPITGVAGDQQAALFGHACFEAGEAKNTYGTGSFALLHTGSARPDSPGGLLATAAASRDGGPAYALEGSIFVTGSAVQWLRDGLGIISSAAEVEPLASSVDDSGGVYVVPAFTGLGAPHWDARARGAIVGLTRGSTSAHIARATLEAIALSVADVIELMEKDSGVELKELRVDGGAVVNDLLMQLQADILGRAVVRPAYVETTALGAAYLAGLGAGVWTDAEVLRRHWKVDRRFEPRMDETRRQALRHGWRRAVERSRDWAVEE